MSEHLSYDRTVELLREVIAEKGEDFVYEPGNGGMCRYVRAGQPSCLVGHVLVRAGLPLHEVAGLDNLSDSGVGSNASLFERWAEYRAVRLLVDAQIQQDSGATWGYALEYALDMQIGEQA